MTAWIRAADGGPWHRVSELEYTAVVERGRFILACGRQLSAADGWMEGSDAFLGSDERHEPCAQRAGREAAWSDRLASCAPEDLIAEAAPGVDAGAIAWGETEAGTITAELRPAHASRVIRGAGATREAAAADLLAALEALAPVLA